MSAAASFHPYVIAFAVWILPIVGQWIVIDLPTVRCAFRRGRLPVLRMKIEHIARQGMRVNLIIDIEEHRMDLMIAFVGQGDSRSLIERHGEKAIQCTVGSNCERNRVVKKILAKAQAEEVSERSFDAGAG